MLTHTWETSDLEVRPATGSRELLDLMARADAAYRNYRRVVVDRAVPGEPLNWAQREAIREFERAERELADYRHSQYEWVASRGV